MKYYSIHFHNLEVLKLQYKTMGNNLVVINNGFDIPIKNYCRENKIPYYDIDCTHCNPSVSHGMAMNFAKSVIDYSDDWAIIDHDTFIVSDIYFGDSDLVGIYQEAGEKPYLNCGRIFGKKHIRLDDINFIPGFENKGDTASNTYKLFSYKIKFIREEYIGVRIEGKLLQDSPVIAKLFLDDELIGYHGFNLSNWTGSSDINMKLELLRGVLNDYN